MPPSNALFRHEVQPASRSYELDDVIGLSALGARQSSLLRLPRCLAKGPLSAPEAPPDERLRALGVGLKLEIRRRACTLMTLNGRSSSYLFYAAPFDPIFRFHRFT